jgi:mono/diheme cytochrome c family protein
MVSALRWFSPVALLALSVVPLQAQNGGPPARTVRDSVFSDAQADRGAGVFSEICSQCHSLDQFRGDAGFLKNWEGRTFLDVFQQLSSTMPNDNPGGLSRRQYVDVMTYLLREGGHPAGRADLSVGESSLKAIMIVPPAGRGRGELARHR